VLRSWWEQQFCSSSWGEVVPLPLNKRGMYLIHYLENNSLKFASEGGHVLLGDFGERRDEKNVFFFSVTARLKLPWKWDLDGFKKEKESKKDCFTVAK